MEIEQNISNTPNTPNVSNTSSLPRLEDIPVSRKVIESLYAHGKLSLEDKNSILNILSTEPIERAWGLWVSWLLLFLGITLILSGITFFFAYNWASMSPIIKLSIIQVGLVTCLFGAFFYSLDNLPGQLLLLCASIFVGVFMAVFGQIYQTGADSYQLFMMWAVLILGWTLISKFSSQWALFLIISNVFLMLWHDQDIQRSNEALNLQAFIYTYLLILNTIALLLREFFVIKKNCLWLQARWTRNLIVLILVVTMFNSVCIWIFEETSLIIFLNGALGILGHGIIFLFYRYKQVDIWPLTIVLFSSCLLVLIVFFNIFLVDAKSSGVFFVLACIALAVFSVAAMYLRMIMKEFEVSYD